MILNYEKLRLDRTLLMPEILVLILSSYNRVVCYSMEH